MRLIDGDALENAIDKERQILIEQGRPGAEHIVVHHARRLVEEAPTIDAIPVTWLCEYSGNHYDATGREVTVLEALRQWKQEQEVRS